MTIVPEPFQRWNKNGDHQGENTNAFYSVIEGYRNEELRIPPTKEPCTRSKLLGIPLLEWGRQINPRLSDCLLPLSQASLWQIPPIEELAFWRELPFQSVRQWHSQVTRGWLWLRGSRANRSTESLGSAGHLWLLAVFKSKWVQKMNVCYRHRVGKFWPLVLT